MAFFPPLPFGIKPVAKPAGNPYANIQVAPKVVPKQNLMRPPAPVSPTVYDGIKKVDSTYKMPNFSVDKFISEQRAKMEDKYDIPNAEIMSAKYPQYRNVNADNTAWNALKHSGTAEQMATKNGFASTVLAGGAHEAFGIARKYYDPRMWGQNPPNQDFGFQEDVRRSLMDMRNNTLGAALGSVPFLTQKQRTAMQDWMLRNGVLKVLKGPQYPRIGGRGTIRGK